MSSYNVNIIFLAVYTLIISFLLSTPFGPAIIGNLSPPKDKFFEIFTILFFFEVDKGILNF